MRRKSKHIEDSLQESCVIWFSLAYQENRRLLHHSPNGGHRNPIEAAKFKRMGVQPGFPDLFLAIPNKDYHGLFIELKIRTGKQSDYQRDMELRLENNGYKYQIIRSIEEFISAIQNYLKDVQTSCNPSSDNGCNSFFPSKEDGEVIACGADVLNG